MTTHNFGVRFQPTTSPLLQSLVMQWDAHTAHWAQAGDGKAFLLLTASPGAGLLELDALEIDGGREHGKRSRQRAMLTIPRAGIYALRDYLNTYFPVEAAK